MNRMYEIIRRDEGELSTKEESPDLVSNKVNVGLEIEFDTYISSSYFEVDNIIAGSDGSLGSEGIELRFSRPLNGVNITDTLKDLQNVFDKKASGIYATQMGGIHVHIDIRKMTLPHLKRFIYLYTLFEKPLFKLMGEERETNPFCTAMYRSLAMRGLLSRVMSSEDLLRLGSPRYSSLNFQAISKFGSLEFRGHETTFDTSRILDWINVLLCLRKAASRTQYKLTNLLKLKEKDFADVLESVFTEDLIDKYFVYDEVVDHMKLGHRFIQDAHHYEKLVDCTNILVKGVMNTVVDAVGDAVVRDLEDHSIQPPASPSLRRSAFTTDSLDNLYFEVPE